MLFTPKIAWGFSILFPLIMNPDNDFCIDIFHSMTFPALDNGLFFISLIFSYTTQGMLQWSTCPAVIRSVKVAIDFKIELFLKNTIHFVKIEKSI